MLEKNLRVAAAVLLIILANTTTGKVPLIGLLVALFGCGIPLIWGGITWNDKDPKLTVKVTVVMYATFIAIFGLATAFVWWTAPSMELGTAIKYSMSHGLALWLCWSVL